MPYIFTIITCSNGGTVNGTQNSFYINLKKTSLIVSSSKSSFDQEQWLPRANKPGKVVRVKERQEEEGRQISLNTLLTLCNVHALSVQKQKNFEKK